MTIRKTGMARLWAILVAAALLAVTVSTDSDAGSTASRTTRVKFSRTMALPGAIVPPGSYSFDILNPATSSDVVVLTSVGRKVHFIGITRRVERPRGVPSNQVITV